MKRFLAVLAAFALSFTALAFVGCGGNNKDKDKDKENDTPVKVEYREPTAQELTDVLTGIDSEKLLGDADEDSPALGVKAHTNFALALKITDDDYVNGSIALDLTETFGVSGLAGSATLALKYDIGSKGKDAQKGDYNITAYNSGLWGFANLKTGDDTSKFKVDFSKLISLLPEGDDDDNSNGTGLEIGSQAELAAEFVELVAKYNLKVLIEDSDGLKMKISATEETVWSILGAKLPYNTVTVLKDATSFKKFNFEAYFALDKTGKLVESSLDVSVELSIDKDALGIFGGALPIAETEDGGDAITFSLEGGAKIELYSGTVTLPAGLTSDTSYFDVTEVIIGLIEGMGE